MTETVETPILAELRQLDGEMQEMRRELATLPPVLQDLNNRLDGLGQLLTLMAGHRQGLVPLAPRLDPKANGA